MKLTAKLNDVFTTLSRLYRFSLIVLSAPVVLADYFHPDTGSEYGVGLTTKLRLVWQMMRNNGRIPTGSTFLEHLAIATKLLDIPADVDGRIVECGCYKGGSTANLSLVASVCGRRLDVFDSFEGMPKPTDEDEYHLLIDSGEIHAYTENSWQSSIDEVRANIAKWGDVSVCTFHKGYFDETMPDYQEECALVFLDVGLRTSAETCIEHLWPRLVDGGYLFTHDVKHIEISSLFFDAEWWRENVGSEPPGLIGAGNGLGLHPGSNGFSSLLGYAIKKPMEQGFERVDEVGASLNCVDTSISGDD